ncbi:MFS transporter [Actinomycetospora straminea]|uniref:MFS transporter n=1 Tax=Actinomycetospora straminea TaxID=663607 RepID=A0ABP9DU32_9PSEU|nr:MFS transporter [Actinomycetospora straminea]MDD7935851.1 MFS transporter [Actinomycetospora straminea]
MADLRTSTRRGALAPAWALWTVVFVVAFGTNVPTPLLLVYRDTLGLAPTTLTAAFGVYAAGLIPALLLSGPASDRLGRRPVVVPFVVLAGLVSVLFLAAGSSVLVLFLGRFLQGAVSGVVFSVGTAWLGELVGEPGRSARLTTIALAMGWALGPLVAGLMGQWVVLPTVLPYLVHVALMVGAVALLPGIPETLTPDRRRASGSVVNLGVPPGTRWAFALVVVPIAIGVFAFPSTAVTVLPLLLTQQMSGVAVAVAGIVAGVTLSTGALVPPLQRRLGAAWSGPVGLGLGALGLGLALLSLVLSAWPLLLPVALLLGAGYGLCLASGLAIVARLAVPSERGALTGTFYACAYLGFGVPYLLSALAGLTASGSLAGPLAGLGVASAVVAALLALPAARRLGAR